MFMHLVSPAWHFIMSFKQACYYTDLLQLLESCSLWLILAIKTIDTIWECLIKE